MEGRGLGVLPLPPPSLSSSCARMRRGAGVRARLLDCLAGGAGVGFEGGAAVGDEVDRGAEEGQRGLPG